MLCAMGLHALPAGQRAHRPPTAFSSVQRHLAGLRPASCPRSFGARAASDRRVPPQSGQVSCFRKRLHPLHAAFVLHLGQSVFHRVDGAVIGEIQLRRVVGVFGFIEDVLFHRRAVIDDLLFLAPSAPGRARPSARPWRGTRRSSATTSAFSTGRPPLRRWSGCRPAPAMRQSTVRTVPVPSQERTRALAN